MGKISANSLSYDQSLPPFLARLHSQYNANNRVGPDPILASQRRAAKPRSASEEAEDRPLVLDDRGETVTGVTFGKDGQTTLDEVERKDGELDGSTAGSGYVDAHGVDVVPDISVSRKRRVGRTIREDSDGTSAEGDNDEHKVDRRERKRTANEDPRSDAAVKDTENISTKDGKRKIAVSSDRKVKKQKKKAKLQLSFEEDED
ncbi:hypothetical protein SEPCBS57363_001215 [Sporothrix epigloea]|uniref:DUF4604 domain-containing protein n=1 Tax=Sporothrix epigloea TaxID=1892477 RepID=A0ABP0DA23_9PEZI